MKRTKFHWYMLQGVGASCWFMWGASTFLSYWGFTRLAPNAPTWVKAIAFGVSASINFVEYMIDNFSWYDFWHPKYIRDYILRAFGAVAYVYDIYTNILGFIGVVGIPTDNISLAFQLDAPMAAFASMFGFLIATGPEPLYIWFLEQNFPFPGVAPWMHLMGKVKGMPVKTQTYYPPATQVPVQKQPTPPSGWQDYVRQHPEKFKNINRGS